MEKINKFMCKTFILTLTFIMILFVSGCSHNQNKNIDNLFISNSGLKYSTITNLDQNKFDEEINYDLNLKYNDLKLYIENSKHYVDRNYMFSLFFPEDFTIKVYDNQIISESENMNIIIRLIKKDNYENNTLFFEDLINALNINLTKELELSNSTFGIYNLTKTQFTTNKTTYKEYLIEKENYLFNLEFKVKSNQIREDYIIDYFYNTILLPLN